MARWEREGIPHKGWKEMGIEDLGEDLESGDDVEYEQCEMCGQEKIRYVHILQHPNFNGELRVGCVCAERMTDDYINPQKTERELKNRLNRKKNFMRREWQERNQGKYVLRYKGENITIIHVITFGSNSRARGRVAHFDGTAGLLVHPVQIGLGVWNFRLNLKNVCTDGIRQIFGNFCGDTAGRKVGDKSFAHSNALPLDNFV